MAEVTAPTVGKDYDDIITTEMRQQTSDERRTIFSHRSEEDEEWKSTSSPTRINMIHKRQELESRILQMVSGGSDIVDLDQDDEEEEVRQQAQERLEEQQDVESRTHQQTHDGRTTQQNRRDSPVKDTLEQISTPLNEHYQSPLNPLNSEGSDEGALRRQSITVSPNLLNLSYDDEGRQRAYSKPNRWRSLDMNLEQSAPPQQRRGSMDRDTLLFGRQRQWQRDLNLTTRHDVKTIVQDKIQIQELQKKVSSLLHDLHESIERETDLEEKVLSLTNQNDLLKEQVLQLQKQLSAISSLSHTKTCTEGTETSSTSVESTSQDPIFGESDSSKDKECRDETQIQEKQSHHIQETRTLQQSLPKPAEADQLAPVPDATNMVQEEVKQSEPSAIREAPMTPERLVLEDGELKSNDIHIKQVDWTPPPKPSRPEGLPPVATSEAHHNHQHVVVNTPPPLPSKGFCIDTCDDSTISYSLYKGMAEIYDGTVDTGMEGAAQGGVPGADRPRTDGDEDDDNWEFLTERVSL